jgi:stage II sporulation protein M
MAHIRYRLWVFIAVGLFVIGLAIGYVISARMPASVSALLSEELTFLEQLGNIFAPFQAATAVFIFLKNVSALLFSFIFSPLLCLLPILALIFNGLILSLISALVVQEESLGLVLAGLLPHGIFEIPALIIGEAAALSFGVTVIIALICREKRNLVLPNLKKNVKYLLLAFALLIPAAIIETFVTPLFLQ